MRQASVDCHPAPPAARAASPPAAAAAALRMATRAHALRAPRRLATQTPWARCPPQTAAPPAGYEALIQEGLRGQGLDLELVPLASLDDRVPALLNGTVDAVMASETRRAGASRGCARVTAARCAAPTGACRRAAGGCSGCGRRAAARIRRHRSHPPAPAPQASRSRPSARPALIS